MVGKDARNDRTELKKLMADGNSGQPVDPVLTPWCAGFMNAVLTRTGWGSTQSLAARSFLNYGAKTKDPDEGDIVVLRRGRDGWSGHVGFFMGYEYYDGTKYVKVLGGNTEKKVDVGYFPVNRVLGYRRLDDAVVAQQQMQPRRVAWHERTNQFRKVDPGFKLAYNKFDPNY
jgi:uncharacterized protein (TIGR02594 family)